MKSSKQKQKFYGLIGMIAIVIITIVLILPFFEKKDVEHSSFVQHAEITRVPNPFIIQLIRDYEKEIDKLMDVSNTPGAAIAIVKDSTIVYIKGFGLKASNGKDSVDIHTVFRLASVSKCFASFYTGVLVEDGVLDWEDPVIKFLPDFELKSPEQTSQLNITHVLSHTTGLPYHTYTNLVEEGIDLPTLLSKLKEVKLSNGVGKEYSYQNVAYSLIGAVISQATGTSYETGIQQQVFVPLNMKNASTDYRSFVSNPNISRPHRMAKRKWVPTSIHDTYYNVSPAGGINASIQDMANWMTALLGHRPDVIKEETLQHLYSPSIAARSKNRNYRKFQRPDNSYYGLGWRILHYPTDTLVYHGGYVTGYRSEIALDPNDDIAICILSNAPSQLADKGIPVFFNLFNKYRESIITWEKNQRVPEPKIPL